MPTLEELDTLKSQINKLGDEPRLLAERGETLGDISPPESAIDSDLEQLLYEDSTGGGIDEMEALLGSYADDLGEPGSEQNGASIDDSFSLDDLEPLEDLDAGEVLEDDLSLDDLTAADVPAGEVPEDDFSLDDLTTADVPAGEVPEDDFSLDDLTAADVPAGEVPEDDFSLDDLTAADVPAGEVPEDDFSLDDLSSDTDIAQGEDEDEGLSLDDSDFGEISLDEEGDTGGLAALEETGNLEELGPVEDQKDVEDIPDVESAVEGLGDLQSLDDEDAGELSLDEDLNFEEELGADVLSDIRDFSDDSQQFSMDDFGDQYNFQEGDEAYTDSLEVDLDELEQSLDEATEGDSRTFSLEEPDFQAIRRTLSGLPRNLKIAIEEILADDRRNPEVIKPLVDALIDGESPKSLVARFRTLTKRTIELPRSYEKRSGLVLETRRASLAYQLVQEGWPVIRTILLIISIGWVLGAAVFMWVYRPLMAERLYGMGLEAIAVDDIDEAVTYFYDAWDGWPLFYPEEEGADRIADSPIVVKGWKNANRWLDYAAALRRRKHWDAAKRFYEGYLRVRPEAKDVRLEYSAFLSGVMGQYEEAVAILENSPASGKRKWDRDYTLAAGDVYLDWAEDDPTMYEEARFRYAKILEVSRNDERAILSMMRYHLRLADDEEINRLLPIFDNEVPGKTDSPELAAEVYAGLGEYNLARGNAEKSRRFINLALAADPNAPEPTYVDAIFWRLAQNQQRELQAYRYTLVNLEGRESLGRNDLEMRILTLGGMGRIQASTGDYSNATGSYTKAIELYEDARARNQLGAAPVYGQLYVEQGDILYRGVKTGGDLPLSLAANRESLLEGGERYSELMLAEQYYNEADELFGSGSGSGLPPESLYRRAYTRYVLGLNSAMLDFHRVARKQPEDYEARIALATVLLDSSDFEASRSQYARTLELLDLELRRTGGFLNPFERQSHAELLLRYVIAWNNLGVGRARSAARGGGEDDYAAALSAFTMASEYLDEVYNDMADLNNRGAVGMRDIEERRVVSNQDGRSLLMEKVTFPYINRLRLLGLENAEEGEDTYLMYHDIPSDLLRGN